MPNLSLMALTMGARPLVVHDAHETAIIDGSYVSSLTPMTTVGESSLAGAEKMIFLAPAAMCGATLSAVRNAPVDSQMYSAPSAENGISAGSRVCDVGVRTPSMRRPMRPKPLMPPATAIDGACAGAAARTVWGWSVLVVDVNAEAPDARRAAEVNFMVQGWV